jgi:large repetitive protein
MRLLDLCRPGILLLFVMLFYSHTSWSQCTDPPTVNPVTNITLCSAQNLNVVFSGTPGASFEWTNDNPAIGVPVLGTGNINTNVVTVIMTQVANFTVRAFIDDCYGPPVNFTVTVTPGTTPPLPNYGTICRSAPPIPLPTMPGGVSGTWSGIGVVNNIFNPAVSLGDPIQLLFVPAPGQCAIPGTITISFFPELFFFVSGFPGPFCEAQGPIDLSGIIQPPGTPGSWGGSGISPGGIFDPALVGGGFHDISFTTNEACPVTIFFGVEVEDANIPTFDPTGPFCVGSTPAPLPTTSINGITGTWSPAAISTNNPGLAAYTFTPAGGQGCVATATIQVVTLAPPVLACAQQNPVSTAGGTDGSATVQISGGTPGYTITWSGAASGSQMQAMTGTAMITGLVAGNYTVTVTDAAGCEQTCAFTIGSPSCNLMVTATGTNPACNGNANGSILLEITNSTGMLSFDWNNNALDGIQNPTGLTAGTYAVTVTDGAGCEAATSVTLSNPPVLGAICAQQNPVSTVGGADGSATVQISGGNAGYTVAWSGAASGSQMQAMPGTATITGLIAGMYTVTVTDANGCAQTCSFTINAPNCIISLSAAPTNPSCNGGNNGSITLTVGNATGLLNFDWSVDSLDGFQNPTGLSAGIYSVTVTDAAGCAANTTVTLNNPSALTANCAQLSPVVTVGGNEGSATVQIFGGTQGYTIVWSGPANGSQMQNIPGTATITGLIAGNYSVTVTDLGGCIQTCTFTIEGTNCNMVLSIAGTNPLCNGGSTGSISLTVNNATGNLTYDWNNDALDGIQNPGGLSAGFYSVTVTDEVGCERTASVTVNNPPALNLVCTQQMPVSTIGGSNGSAIVQISGGTAGYTIAWSGPSSGSQMSASMGASSIIGLAAGDYSVTVTDTNGCEQTCTFTINGPNCNISLSATGTNPLCNGNNNGAIALVVNNSSGNLTFDWNVDALDGIQNPTGLGAGTYSVIVTDAAGCTASTSVTLTDPAALAIVCAQQNPASTVGGADGSATVQISGGTAPYAIVWSGAANGSQMQAIAGTATITGLIAGDYNVTVTDANGCETTCTFTIGQPVCTITANIAGTDPLCNGSSDGAITLIVNNATGALNFDWNDNTLDGIQNPVGLAAGTYSVTVTDAVNCQTTASVTLTNPPALNVVCAEENPVSTVDGNDGSATVQISGGTPGYTLSWNGPVSGNTTLDNPGTATLNDLESGDYTLAVTDANGCEQTCTFFIDKPLCDITIDIMGADPLCNGGMNGAIALLVNGATGALNFDWNDNTLDGIQNPTGLIAGTYSVTVTDAINCDATATITLVNPPVVTLACAQQNPVSTSGGSDGSATVQISGGTAGYIVDWFGPVNGSQTQDAPGTATITGLPAGNYMVFVTDANGCEQTCSFSIGDPGCNIVLNISGAGPLCNGSADGAITLIVSNATGNLNFDWNVNALDGIQNPTGLMAGSYSVTVTDDASCEAVISVTLNNPPVLNITCAQQNPVSTIGGSNGSATVQISGGTAPYNIAWSGPANGSQMQMTAGTATITGLVAGNYSVLVTDANGCEQTCNFIINSPDCNISLNISGTNPLCNGGNTGTITLMVSGSTGALNFDWNVDALDGIQNPTGLSAGTYAVTVTDGAGCAANTSVTLANPALLAIICAQQNPVSTVGGNDGAATVQISGGTAPYTVAWSGPANGSQMQMTAGTATVTGLIAGNYSVVVTDANGCTQTCTFSIGSPDCNITLDLTGTDPLCNGGTDGEITLVVNGATGLLEFDWNDDALDGIQNPTGLGAGTYTVLVTDEEGCTATATVTLGEPDAIALVCAEENPVSAIGANDGSATVAISGGTAGYTIDWSGPVNGSATLDDPGTATITDLEAGTYTVLVTDANGCEATCTFTITEPSNCNITLDLTGTDPLCNGGTDGEITLVVNGATGYWNLIGTTMPWTAFKIRAD